VKTGDHDKRILRRSSRREGFVEYERPAIEKRETIVALMIQNPQPSPGDVHQTR